MRFYMLPKNTFFCLQAISLVWQVLDVNLRTMNSIARHIIESWRIINMFTKAYKVCARKLLFIISIDIIVFGFWNNMYIYALYSLNEVYVVSDALYFQWLTSFCCMYQFHICYEIKRHSELYSIINIINFHSDCFRHAYVACAVMFLMLVQIFHLKVPVCTMKYEVTLKIAWEV